MSDIIKEQTKPNNSAKISVEANIRFPLIRNQSDFSNILFWLCRNRTMFPNFGFNRSLTKIKKDKKGKKEYKIILNLLINLVFGYVFILQ